MRQLYLGTESTQGQWVQQVPGLPSVSTGLQIPYGRHWRWTQNLNLYLPLAELAAFWIRCGIGSDPVGQVTVCALAGHSHYISDLLCCVT